MYIVGKEETSEASPGSDSIGSENEETAHEKKRISLEFTDLVLDLQKDKARIQKLYDISKRVVRKLRDLLADAEVALHGSVKTDFSQLLRDSQPRKDAASQNRPSDAGKFSSSSSSSSKVTTKSVRQLREERTRTSSNSSALPAAVRTSFSSSSSSYQTASSLNTTSALPDAGAESFSSSVSHPARTTSALPGAARISSSSVSISHPPSPVTGPMSLEHVEHPPPYSISILGYLLPDTPHSLALPSLPPPPPPPPLFVPTQQHGHNGA